MKLHYLTDTDLIEVAHAEASLLSYYHAGWDYPDSARQEDAARRRCDNRFHEIMNECLGRGLTVPNRGYLARHLAFGPDDRA